MIKFREIEHAIDMHGTNLKKITQKNRKTKKM